jgi:hypothetical protein
MEKPARSTVKTGKTGARIATAVFVAAVLGIAVMALPRGFDTDLTKIGAGKPALVFVYDPNLVASNQQTREMDVLRESLGDTLHFLIADVGRPDAQQFMQRYQATRTQLLLFAPDGRLVLRMQGPATSEQLLRSIDDVASQ